MLEVINFILIKKCLKLKVISFLTNKLAIGDLSLSLTGMRIAPRDPTTHTAKVGIKNEV